MQSDSGGQAVVLPAGWANVELARDTFKPHAHRGSGVAGVVLLLDESRLLMFGDLETDAGPDLRVYLVASSVDDDRAVGDFVDIGALTGNIGDQQYEIPTEVDLTRCSTAVVWSRLIGRLCKRRPASLLS